MVALTKDFKETIQARAQRDSAFRKALLQKCVECLLAGDVDTGKAVPRDYILVKYAGTLLVWPAKRMVNK